MQKSRFLTVLASSVRAPSLAAALALAAVGGCGGVHHRFGRTAGGQVGGGPSQRRPT